MATLGLIAISLVLGMGLGALITLLALWKGGVFKAYDVDELVSRMTDDDYKGGGSD